ncbi:MAG: hypothetical protein ACI4DU_11355 [Lachnospiraceae bacterium]
MILENNNDYVSSGELSIFFTGDTTEEVETSEGTYTLYKRYFGVTVSFDITLEADKQYNFSLRNNSGENKPVCTIIKTDVSNNSDTTDDWYMRLEYLSLATKSTSTGTITQQSYLENTNSIPNPSYSLVAATADVGASPDAYYCKLSSDTDYSSSISVPTGMPTSPGQYSLKAVWNEGYSYLGTEAICNFTVYDVFSTVAIQVPNVTYGESISPTVTLDGANASGLSVDCAYQYKTAGADDSTYSATMPTAVGDYVAKVTANYAYPGITDEIGTATTTFSIGKREGNGSITVANIRYGAGKVTPQVSSDRNGTNNVTITYKQQGAADSTYTSTVPTVPGKYTARAVFAATDTTKEYTATTNFEITKATGTAYVTASDIYYGGKLETTVSTTAANAGTPVLEYKLQGADNSTYTTTVPTAVGEYTIRATYPESAYYTAFSATYNFSITYMPAPTYTITGTKGTNDYFTSAVTITPEAGYQVATALDGEYASQVRVLSTKEVPLLYFRNAETGGKSDGVSTEDILIDASVPLISNTPEEDELFEDNWYFTVSDLNLFKIFINGEPVDFTGSSAQITFDAEGGRKEYHIEIVDRAGNVTEYDFVLSAKWLQEGIIPVGEPVMLEPDTPYTLSEGESVTIEGDSTSYAGGMTVYVREPGQFTFN